MMLDTSLEQGIIYEYAEITLGGILTYVVISATVAYAAAYLLAPKPPKNPLDDSKSEPSIRGSLASFLLGRMRIGPIIGYVGDRQFTKESVGGGKGGGSGPKKTIYSEVGMHIISTGLGVKIKAIYQAGEQILEDAIDSTTTPSGTEVDLDKEGSFRVYWGEETQPVDARLAGLTGLASSFPYIFYVVWDSKRLGQNAIWPQIEYDVEIEHPAGLSLPTDGEYIRGARGAFDFTGEAVFQPSTAGFTSIYSQTTSTDFVITTTDSSVEDLQVGSKIENTGTEYSGEVVNVLSNGVGNYLIYTNRPLVQYIVQIPVPGAHTFNYIGVEYSGVNPASALYQMLFSSFPQGLGWPTSRFNLTDFNTLASLFKTTETAPCTVLLRSGKSFKDGIASILQDFGIVFWFDTTTEKWRLSVMREGDASATISADDYVNNELAREIGYSTLSPKKIVYSFKDSAKKFTDSTILVSNDAEVLYSDNPNSRKVPLNTVTDFVVASMIASRMEQEASVNEAVTIDISYDYIDAEIGSLFELEGLTGAYRLLVKDIKPDSASLKASLVLDVYSASNDYRVLAGGVVNPVSTVSPSPDLQVSVLETNRFLSKDENGFFVPRIRANGSIIGADIYTSADDSTYAFLSEQAYVTGGTLVSELGMTSTLVESGIFIDTDGPDISDVEDLTSSHPLWRGGAQLAVIGTEICFLEFLDRTGDELIGLIRARYGTKMQVHAAGTPVYILQPETMSLLSRSFLSPEASLYVKSRPFTSREQLSQNQVDAVSINYKGGGFRPLSCENLFTSDGTNAWEAGSDIDLRWSYKNVDDTGAAGVGLSGESSTPADPEGTFRLEILNGLTVVRTINQAGTTYTYSNANLVADFGSEPASFDARVYEVLNGLTSEAETVTINRA